MSDEVNKNDVTSAADHDELTAHQEPDFLALEERIMFDGAMGAEAVDAAVDQVDDDTSSPAPEPDLEAAAATVSAPASDRSEIYFVDAGVDNPDELISAIPDGAEVVVLDGNSDGLAQIASALDGRSDLDAIHILSHGDAGQITLGSTTLDATSIDGHHADELATIGSALSDDADILIYGCDFGQDEATLAALADATGADVAASDDDTGHADLGGDWDLEVSHGGIEAQTLTAEGFFGVLAQPEVTDAEADSPRVTAEDTGLAITGITVADADDGVTDADNDGNPDDVVMEAQFSVSGGTVTLASSGASVTGGADGSASVTIQGSVAEINAALDGMTFTPDADQNGTVSGYDPSIEINFTDTTNGDSTSYTVGNLSVSAVNDAPDGERRHRPDRQRGRLGQLLRADSIRPGFHARRTGSDRD